MSAAGPGDPADRQAIADLADAYAAAVDRRDLPALRSVFTEDGRLSVHLAPDAPPRDEFVGHQGLAGVIERVARFPTTFHLLGNRRYHVEGDEARGEVCCVAHHMTPGDGGPATNDVMYIRYLDAYRRETGRWLIQDRRLAVDWSEHRVDGDAWLAAPPGRPLPS